MGLGAPSESELLSLGALKDRCTSQLRCAAHDHFLPCELCDLEAESGWRCEKCGHASPARAPDGTEHACKSRTEFRRTGRIAFAEALDPAVPSPAPKPPPPGRPPLFPRRFFPSNLRNALLFGASVGAVMGGLRILLGAVMPGGAISDPLNRVTYQQLSDGVTSLVQGDGFASVFQVFLVSLALLAIILGSIALLFFFIYRLSKWLQR